MRRLPFLNGLRAFEAAARCGSFALAARELSVTPAAVSRMVRLLEQRLGVALFERSANRLTATPAGREYQAGLSQLFDSLVALTDRVSAAAGPRTLTVGVGPTFAMRWLIPRLADFRRVAPEVEVRIVTGGPTAPFGDDWTCGVKLDDGRRPGLVSEPLFAADLLPVCAPSLAASLRAPSDLKPATLLRVSHSPGDWPRWLKAAGQARLAARGPEFEYYGQALQAAIDGLGVAMGIRPYVDDELAAGRLVAPFALATPKETQWYLLYRPARAAEPDFQAFRRWIGEAAQAQGRPPRGRRGGAAARLAASANPARTPRKP